MDKETWRNHPLYKLSAGELQQKCKEHNLPFKGPKFVLTKAIAQSRGEVHPQEFKVNYHGNLEGLPKTVAALKKLPIACLQFILKMHNQPITGDKDNLVLRLFLLRNGRGHLVSYWEVREITKIIGMTKKAILHQIQEEVLNLSEVRCKRKYSTTTAKKSVILPTEDSCTTETLPNLLDPLLRHLQAVASVNKETTEGVQSIKRYLIQEGSPEQGDYESLFEIGKKVNIKWTADEIGDSGWRPGWYVAEVQSASMDTDEISVVYLSEPDVVYTIEVTPLLAQGKLVPR